MSFEKLQEKEKQRLIQQILHETHLGAKGEIRWNSNNNCVPMDCFKTADIDPPAAQQECVSADAAETIAEYRKFREREGYTEEEIAEMKAAFGDEAVVDVLTGKRIKV